MFHLAYPKNNLLKKHIRHIFFYECNTNCFKQYIIFPNTGTALTLYNNVVYYKNEQIYVSEEKKEVSEAMVHVMRTDPIEVVDIGRQNRITVVFNDLGINRFISNDLFFYVNNEDPTLVPGKKLFPDIDGLLNKIISLSSIEEKVTEIEHFLIEHYNESVDDRLEEALALLKDHEKRYPLNLVCKKIGVSPRNLRRIFQNHLIISPVEYRKINQFRMTLNDGLNNAKKIKDLALDAEYYDPSYMIKMYKKYTGTNPKHLFKNLDVPINGKFIYRLL
jgi:AraC-like DNA-binding protein